MRPLALIGFLIPTLFGQQPDDLQPLIDRLRAAPIELQVHGLLQLVETGRTQGRLDEIKLIEECFHLAAQAQRANPVQVRGGRIVEDPDVRLMVATGQRLDRLSLQSWAVTLLASRSPSAARNLFQLLRPPAYRPLTCADGVLDVSAPYYRALAVVLSSTFTPRQRADGQPAALARAEIERLTSPLQLDPLLAEFLKLQWTRDEYSTLIPTLGARLVELHVDDRTFSASSRDLHGLIPKLEQFGLNGRALGVAADPIALGIRQYLAVHLSSERCADTAANDPPPPEGVLILPKPPHPAFPDPSLPEPANYFNHKLRLAAFFPSTDLPPLAPEQMRPARIHGSAASRRLYWSNERDITVQAQNLMWGGRTNAPLTLAERQTPEWDRKAQEYRRLVADYRRAQGQPAESWFLHRSGLMMALWTLMPDGPPRDEVLADVVRFLASVDRHEVGIDLWVLGVRDVMDRARRGRPDRSVSPAVLQALLQSGDPALSLLVEMDSWK